MRKIFYSLFYILSVSIIFPGISYSQNRDISFYQDQAKRNNITLNQNEQLSKINLLQEDLINFRILNPHVYVTSDYLFAPYFNSDGRIISVTPNPGPGAVGYDPAVSNGGFYGALLNVEVPLLNSPVAGSLINQNKIEKRKINLTSSETVHELEKQVSESYLNTINLQEQINYLDRIIILLGDRKIIIETLVQKSLMQQSDYMLIDIEQYSRKIEKIQLEQLLTESYTSLNNICGIKDTVHYDLTVPEIIQKQQLNSFKIMERYKLDSLSIAAEQDVINTSFNPQLSLIGNAGLQSTDLTNIQNHFGTGIGLHLNIPISNGNQKDIQLQQNHISFDTLALSKSNQLTNIINSLNGLNKQILLTKDLIDLNLSQVKSQELLLKILEDKIISGQVSVIEYVKSIEDNILTNQNLLNTKIKLWQLINQYNYLNW